MLQLERLNPNQRLVIESPVNKYKVAGPGRVALHFRQRIIARLEVGPKAKSFQIKEIRTSEDVVLNATVQVLYKVDPTLFSADLLPRVAGLNEGGWRGALQWQAEYVLRLLTSQYSWKELNRDEIQKRLERQFTQTLAAHLKIIGLNIFSVCLVKTELPVDLQEAIIRAERDTIEAQGRAKVLSSYFEIFGNSLAKAMPYIIQWELMNTIHKHGDPTVLLTPDSLQPKPMLPVNGTARIPSFNMQLPLQ